VNTVLGAALLVSMAAVLGHLTRLSWIGWLPTFGEFLMLVALLVAWSALLFGSCG
jgi:hypothetical protein